ncbi:hypothetical protein T08_7598 [Trichinella sp. T8]|nr:hypothetical protein T08_7598 [Trichinella sp. T8]
MLQLNIRTVYWLFLHSTVQCLVFFNKLSIFKKKNTNISTFVIIAHFSIVPEPRELISWKIGLELFLSIFFAPENCRVCWATIDKTTDR